MENTMAASANQAAMTIGSKLQKRDLTAKIYANNAPKIFLETVTARTTTIVLAATYTSFIVGFVYDILTVYKGFTAADINVGATSCLAQNTSIQWKGTTAWGCTGETTWESFIPSVENVVSVSLAVKQSNVSSIVNNNLYKYMSTFQRPYELHLWACYLPDGCGSQFASASDYSDDKWHEVRHIEWESLSFDRSTVAELGYFQADLLPSTFQNQESIPARGKVQSYYFKIIYGSGTSGLLVGGDITNSAVGYTIRVLSHPEFYTASGVFSCVLIFVALATLVGFIHAMLDKQKTKWLSEQKWICFYLIALILFINPFYCIIVWFQYVPTETVFAFYICDLLAQASFFVIWLLFADSYQRKKSSRWSFYGPKILLGFAIFALSMTRLIYQFPDMDSRGKLNDRSAVLAVENWSSELKDAFIGVSVTLVALVGLWAMWWLMTIINTGRALAKLPYMNTRYIQLSFRFFTIQAYMVAVYYVFQVGAVIFYLIKYAAAGVTSTTDITGIINTLTREQTQIFGKVVFLSVYALAMAFLFLPTGVMDSSLATALASTFVITEKEMRETVQIRRAAIRSVGMVAGGVVTHLVHAKEEVFCVDIALSLCNISFEAYYDPTGCEETVSSFKTKPMELEKHGFKLVDVGYNKEHETFCFIARHLASKKIVICFRGTSCDLHWNDNLNYKQRLVDWKNFPLLHIDAIDGLDHVPVTNLQTRLEALEEGKNGEEQLEERDEDGDEGEEEGEGEGDGGRERRRVRVVSSNHQRCNTDSPSRMRGNSMTATPSPNQERRRLFGFSSIPGICITKSPGDAMSSDDSDDDTDQSAGEDINARPSPLNGLISDTFGASIGRQGKFAGSGTEAEPAGCGRVITSGHSSMPIRGPDGGISPTGPHHPHYPRWRGWSQAVKRYKHRKRESRLNDNGARTGEDVMDSEERRDGREEENEGNDDDEHHWSVPGVVRNTIADGANTVTQGVNQVANTVKDATATVVGGATDIMVGVASHTPGLKNMVQPFVHSGFFEAYLAVRDFVHTTLRRELAQSPAHVYFTGHSLGGALSTIAALDVTLHTIPRVQAYLDNKRKTEIAERELELRSRNNLLARSQSSPDATTFADSPGARVGDYSPRSNMRSMGRMASTPQLRRVKSRELFTTPTLERARSADGVYVRPSIEEALSPLSDSGRSYSLACRGGVAGRGIFSRYRPPPKYKIKVTHYTFGSPRVGNGTFSQLFNKTIPDSFRVVVDGDIVTAVPPAGYRHVGTQALLDDCGAGSIIVDPSFVERRLHTHTKTSLSAHSLTVYRKGLQGVKNAVAYLNKYAESIKKELVMNMDGAKFAVRAALIFNLQSKLNKQDSTDKANTQSVKNDNLAGNSDTDVAAIPSAKGGVEIATGRALASTATAANDSILEESKSKEKDALEDETQDNSTAKRFVSFLVSDMDTPIRVDHKSTVDITSVSHKTSSSTDGNVGCGALGGDLGFESAEEKLRLPDTSSQSRPNTANFAPPKQPDDREFEDDIVQTGTSTHSSVPAKRTIVLSPLDLPTSDDDLYVETKEASHQPRDLDFEEAAHMANEIEFTRGLLAVEQSAGPYYVRRVGQIASNAMSTIGQLTGTSRLLGGTENLPTTGADRDFDEISPADEARGQRTSFPPRASNSDAQNGLSYGDALIDRAVKFVFGDTPK